LNSLEEKMKVGFVTIGQTPRDDVVSEMRLILGENIEIKECGALDGLSLEEIKELAPKNDEPVLITRLRNGREIKLNPKKIASRLQSCIEKLEEEVDVIGILCTGEFQSLKSKKLLIKPSLVLMNTVDSLLQWGKLGVFIPSSDQVEEAEKKWSRVCGKVEIATVSPYVGKEGETKKAAERLKDCTLIVLDCFGYNLNTKRAVSEITKRPVILPRTLIAHVIGVLA
jgi:protein AroM